MNTSECSLEKCYHQWPDILNHNYDLDEKDSLQLSQTSKFWYSIILKKKLQDATNTLLTFSNFLSSSNIKIYPMTDLSCFDNCRTIFETKVAKIKKIVDLSLLLHQLDDDSKIILRNSIKTKLNGQKFSEIIKHLKTEVEIEKEIEEAKAILLNRPNIDVVTTQIPYRKIIHFLLISGHFKKASELLKIQNLKFKIKKIEKKYKNYTYFYAPFLSLNDRLTLFRDFLGEPFFSKKTVKKVIKNFATRMDCEDIACLVALLSYMTLATTDFFRKDPTAKLTILKNAVTTTSALKALAMRVNTFEELYEIIKTNFFELEIEKDLRRNDFKSAMTHANAFTFPQAKQKAISKINTLEIKSKIRPLLLSHDFNDAIRFASLITEKEERNFQFLLIATEAINCKQLDIGFIATRSIMESESSTDPFFDTDHLFFAITIRQRFSLACSTFKNISNKNLYIYPFCIHISRIIGEYEIPDALDLICTLEDTQVAMQCMRRIVRRLFPESDPKKWILFSNHIHCPLKRRIFLDFIFQGLQENKNSILFDKSNFYETLVIQLQTGQLEQCIETIGFLKTRWERYIVLYRVIYHLAPNENWIESLQNINKIDENLLKTF